MEIQDLLGRPIHSPEIKDFFAQYHLPQKTNPEYDAYGNLFWVRVNNEENTIRCLFTGYVRYARTYGEPRSARSFAIGLIHSYAKRDWN